MALTHEGLIPTNDKTQNSAPKQPPPSKFNKKKTAMLLVPMVAAAAAATLGLTVASVKNMAQTFQVSKNVHNSCSWTTPPTNAHEAVSQLQTMKRRELLELFLSCEAPSNISELKGEWNGALLENNGWILVRTRY